MIQGLFLAESAWSPPKGWVKNKRIQDDITKPHNIQVIFPIMLFISASAQVWIWIRLPTVTIGIFYPSFLLTAIVYSRTSGWMVCWQDNLSWDSWLPLNKFYLASGTYSTMSKHILQKIDSVFIGSLDSYFTVTIDSPIPIVCIVSPFFVQKWRDLLALRHQSF